MDIVDLRSDTVTQPTPAMREAMARAVVGDDVYGEDPTVNRLQDLAASLVGQEAGLFVPTGTMGNLAAILAHCQRGDEVILGNKAHTFMFEAGGISALGGVHSSQLPNQADGTLELGAIEAAIRPDDAHHPITRLITLENTNNRCGGVALTPEYTRAVSDLAHRHGLRLHLDGARIFNAAVSQGVRAIDLAGMTDSVTFCLSKGLSAPVGSVLCGSHAFIQQAHRIRKQLGGGMRQAGVLAAAGIVALETMIDRLAEDHRRARMLADGLRQIPGLELDPAIPYTNMVFLNLADTAGVSRPERSGGISPAGHIAARLNDYGVRVGVAESRRFRLVTHCWVTDAHVAQTIAAFQTVMAAG
ncbi:MAG TPA: low-specificity L-threonine aldolase [Anaerolineales bacterium]|nr:low-specificity L-threonine aldolase [Anaerolineales bacterium]